MDFNLTYRLVSAMLAVAEGPAGVKVVAAFLTAPEVVHGKDVIYQLYLERYHGSGPSVHRVFDYLPWDPPNG